MVLKYNNQLQPFSAMFWNTKQGFSLRILVAGERYNVRGEYFERGSTSEYKIVTGYPRLLPKKNSREPFGLLKYKVRSLNHISRSPIKKDQ